MTRKVVRGAFGFLAAGCVTGSFIITLMGADVRVYSQNANSSTTDQTNKGAPPADAPEDLSGTYTGKVTMTGGHEMSGEATLTINGNSFTLHGEGMSHSGRISAVNTRKYIGSTLMFEDIEDAQTKTKLFASVRVRKGKTFSMTPIAESKNKLTFTGKKS
jgi:hypothetical protein